MATSPHEFHALNPFSDETPVSTGAAAPPLTRTPPAATVVLNGKETTLLDVSTHGTRMIQRITAFLSTLPHPIEPIEELVSVCSVTCSLLVSLDAAIPTPGTAKTTTTPPLQAKPQPFVRPLTRDILYAFTLLESLVVQAMQRKVFLPNETGLVRLPRVAWGLVCGGREQELRSRCYVEKFRVRVLIDAAVWYFGSMPGPVPAQARASEEGERAREVERVRGRLGLVSERLEGVWRDYGPRVCGEVGRSRPDGRDGLSSSGPQAAAPAQVWPTKMRAEPVKVWEERIESEKEKIRIQCASAESLVSSCSGSSSSRYVRKALSHCFKI